MGFDIEAAGSIETREDEGCEVRIIDPRTSEAVATVRVVGTYSKTYRREWDAQTNRLIRQRRTAKPTTEEMEAQQAELVGACVLDWDGFMLAGRTYPFSRENAIKLCKMAPFICEQISAAMKDHERFFSNGSPSSSPTPATSGD